MSAASAAMVHVIRNLGRPDENFKAASASVH